MQIFPFLILTIDSKDFLKETQDKFIFEDGYLIKVIVFRAP